MSWWSWAIVGDGGLLAVLLASLVTLHWVIRLRSRLQCRRLIEGAERFLAGVAMSAGSPSGPS